MRWYQLAWVALVLAPATAHAFKIETPLTPPFHEDITLEAVEASGFPDRVQAPAPTADQRRAMDDLPFTLSRRDPWTLALLFGVRFNDVRDLPSTDASGLVDVHNDPGDQAAHCLRGPADDGAGGDAGALAACRTFMLEQLEAGGLHDDALDLDAAEVEPCGSCSAGGSISSCGASRSTSGARCTLSRRATRTRSAIPTAPR